MKTRDKTVSSLVCQCSESDLPQVPLRIEPRELESSLSGCRTETMTLLTFCSGAADRQEAQDGGWGPGRRQAQKSREEPRGRSGEKQTLVGGLSGGGLHGLGLGAKGFEEPLMIPGCWPGFWWVVLFFFPLEGASRRSWAEVVAGGDVNLDVMWVLEGPVGPRRGPVGSSSLRGSSSPSCPPGDAECRSLLGCSAAGCAPGPAQRIPPATLAQGCLSPPRPAVCAALQGQATSPETGFQELPRGRLPALPGTSGDGGAVPWEPGWLIRRIWGRTSPGKFSTRPVHGHCGGAATPGTAVGRWPCHLPAV